MVSILYPSDTRGTKKQSSIHHMFFNNTMFKCVINENINCVRLGVGARQFVFNV